MSHLPQQENFYDDITDPSTRTIAGAQPTPNREITLPEWLQRENDIAEAIRLQHEAVVDEATDAAILGALGGMG